LEAEQQFWQIALGFAHPNSGEVLLIPVIVSPRSVRMIFDQSLDVEIISVTSESITSSYLTAIVPIPIKRSIIGACAQNQPVQTKHH
jgi:hypothetical protein